MEDNQLELDRFEKISMRMYTRFGAGGLIVLVTFFSVVISVVATISLVSMLVNDSTSLADLKNPLTYIHIAILIPLFVAPLCCSVFTRLLKRLNIAYQRVTELSTTDPLTGSANRRGFMDNAKQNLHTLIEADACMVGMVDLDNFKFVNDTYGHQLGDEALTRVADSLKHVIGDMGLVGRLGGDEFAFIALGPIAKLKILEDQLYRHCTQLKLSNGSSFSSSIGIVTLHEAESLETSLARADKLLYELKSGNSSTLATSNVG